MTLHDPHSPVPPEVSGAMIPLLRHQRDPDHLTQLQAVTDGHAQPAAPGLRAFDAMRFQRLLDIAGPSMAGTLLRHLLEDLANCRTIIGTGAKGPDWDALREGSHVLISLAGSAGASSLQAFAEAMNIAAQGHDKAAAASVMPSMLGELEALITLIGAKVAPTEGGR